MLAPQRLTKINALFSTVVIQALAAHGVVLTENQRTRYKNEIAASYATQQNRIEYARKSKHSMGLPYTLIMIDDDPCLVVPAPTHYKRNPINRIMFNAVPKILISLTSGVMKFYKVYRPKRSYCVETMSKRETIGLKLAQVEHDYRTRPTRAGEKFYVITPFHQGNNLHQFMHQRETTPEHMFSAFKQACQQIAQWHAQGLLYLDFKPTNIMFDPKSGKASLIDYETLCPTHTLTTELRGTTHYIHPMLLQARREKKPILYTKPADIYPILETASELFTWMGAKTKHVTCRKLLYHYVSIFEDLAKDTQQVPPKPRPMEELPTIQAVLALIDRAERAYVSLRDAQNTLEPAHGAFDKTHVDPQRLKRAVQH